MGSPRDRNSGFTLIELMMVIAVLSILVSWVTIGTADILAKVRDRKRFADLKTFYLAVMQYKYDHNNVLPITSCAGTLNPAVPWASFDAPDFKNNPICDASGTTLYPNLAAALAPYISGSMMDPKRMGHGLNTVAASFDGDKGYKYASDDGVDFTIKLYGTPENMHNFPREFWRPWDDPPGCNWGCCYGSGQPDADGQCNINTIIMRSPDSVY